MECETFCVEMSLEIKKTETKYCTENPFQQGKSNPEGNCACDVLQT